MIVGITGAKRSGKSTLASLLRHRHGFFEETFAGPIRRFVADILSVPVERLEECKESGIDWLDDITPRHLMQTIGTEWGRAMIHPEIWLRRVQSAILTAPDEDWVIADVRFPNEAELIRRMGGRVVRVSRPGHEYTGQHASEQPLPCHLVDVELHNTGTPEGLLAAAESALGLSITA
jgi:hypothetical protein